MDSRFRGNDVISARHVHFYAGRHSRESGNPSPGSRYFESRNSSGESADPRLSPSPTRGRAPGGIGRAPRVHGDGHRFMLWVRNTSRKVVSNHDSDSVCQVRRVGNKQKCPVFPERGLPFPWSPRARSARAWAGRPAGRAPKGISPWKPLAPALGRGIPDEEQRVERPRKTRFPGGILVLPGHGSRHPVYSFSSRSSASRFARLVVRRIPCASLRLLAAWVSMIACLISSTALGWTLNSMSPMPRRRRV